MQQEVDPMVEGRDQAVRSAYAIAKAIALGGDQLAPAGAGGGGHEGALSVVPVLRAVAASY
jgi:hypothetical protein